MLERWQPLGPVAVISAFNFPVAVWAWNAALALVCGDPVIWKPTEKTPMTVLAVQAVFERALARFGDAPEGLSQVVIGGADGGEALIDDPRVPLVSATGSTRMGRAVAPRVVQRFGRCPLELGGNNAMIVTPSADLEMALIPPASAQIATRGQANQPNSLTHAGIGPAQRGVLRKQLVRVNQRGTHHGSGGFLL